MDAEALRVDRLLIRLALTITLGILVLIWGVHFIDDQFDLGWKRFGNRPLHWSGVYGILAMPFLHGDFQHLWGNTVSFFTLNAMLLYFYRDLGIKVLAWCWVGTGVLLWLSGAQGNHIGLSGVVYAEAAFLFLSGLLRRHPRLIRVAMVVVFLYGSIVWGVFPIEEGVSWEGHLSGASMGTLLAWVWRKQGPQRPPLPPHETDAPSGAPVDSDVLGESAVEDTWLTASPFDPEAEARLDRRAPLLWRGPRPQVPEHAKSRRGGIRKPLRGGHIKSKTRR